MKKQTEYKNKYRAERNHDLNIKSGEDLKVNFKIRSQPQKI